MKILHYINNLGSGGAEKLLTDILPAFKEKEIEVTLLVANHEKSVEKYVKLLNDKGIEIINFNMSFYNPIQIFKLFLLINKRKFDIIHAHLFPTQYWLAIASLLINKKTKLIKTEHSVFNERKNYTILRPIERFVYSRYDNVIAITEQVEENLKNWIRNLKSSVIIYNGINLDEVRVEQDSNLEYTLSEGTNLLMVGRFDGSQKDQMTLVKALEILPENYNLYFAGDGPYMEEVIKYTVNSNIQNRVHFLGRRNDVYRLMKAVDLNVLSTNHEGLSGVTLEGLASRRPFIGSNVVGVNNIVPDESFLFPPKDFQELAQKIKWIISNPNIQKVMIDKSLEHVKSFDTSIMVTNYINLYNRTIKNE